jgi:EpsI family protein
MVFEKNSLRVLANYWFQQRGRIIISEYANKWYLFRDSLLNRRSDGALVRIEMPLSQGQEVAAAQALMNSFAKELMKVLPRYVPG